MHEKTGNDSGEAFPASPEPGSANDDIFMIASVSKTSDNYKSRPIGIEPAPLPEREERIIRKV
jgi:hypothetical protein